MARVVLGVSGGIAAYKAASLLRLLTEDGHRVRVVPTRSALSFVGAATWAALSGEPVTSEVFDDVHAVPHVALGQQADLVVVAPATADLMARAVHGRADDLLTSVLLTARCPVVMAPAMHTEMWQHPATQANVATLRERGVLVVDPAVGRLTGADSGRGRLPEPEALAEVCRRVLARGAGAPLDLAGRTVVVSAGGTREPLDPVRFLGNRSSGKQGYALAATAVARGAQVVVVAANVELPDPAGATVVAVGTAAELRDAVVSAAADADALVMAAAVADFRPVAVADRKLKKADGAPEIVLEPTTDILAALGKRRRAGQTIVGFAAETDDLRANAADKLARKGIDLIVANDVSAPGVGFEHDTNAVVILDAAGGATEIPLSDKRAIARSILDAVIQTRSNP